MARLLFLSTVTDSFPAGYQVIFYADGLADGGVYEFGKATSDDPVEHPPYPEDDPCLGYIDILDDESPIGTFNGNALGYDYLTFEFLVPALYEDVFLHDSGRGSQKGPVGCISAAAIPVSHPMDTTYRVGGGFSFEIVGGGAGPALATMGVLSGSPGNASATLNWTAATPSVEAGTVNYRVRRGLSPTSLGPVGSLTAGLSYVDSGLTNGVTYYYQIEAGIDLGSGEHLIAGGEAGTFSTAFRSNIVAVTPLALAISFDDLSVQAS